MPVPESSTLRQPVTEEDLVDHMEYCDVAAGGIESLFHRLRYQYQQDTWISNELWLAFQEMKAGVGRLQRLQQTRALPHE
jgi:hypothetical protein